jgi:polyphosphate kinase
MTLDDRRGTGEFFNRELSWLAFNERVLEEALDRRTPLLERLRFATIVASNLDEFFMVRVAGLKSAVREGVTVPDVSGLAPLEQLSAVTECVRTMVTRLYREVRDVLLPGLERHGIRLLAFDALDPHSRAAAAAYFQTQVLPALTPLAIDVERPFPVLSSLSINLAFWLEPSRGQSDRRMAIVQVPSRLPRLVRLASADAAVFVLLDEIIRAESAAIFPGQAVVESAVFRPTRDAELELDDEGGESFLELVEQSLRQRRSNVAVRVELEEDSSPEAADQLRDLLEIEPADVYRLPHPLDVRALNTFIDLPGFDALRYPAAPPVPMLTRLQQDDIFALLDDRDLLLHHPYESFDPVVALVEAAADDPDVLAIKQTLYRTSGDSPIVAALTRAADEGKQVTVLVELMARFDESRNIRWARRLEEMGAHVIFGIRHFKVHAKICLVVRRTTTGLTRYVHLGTGNYNDGTARVYTDMGLMTSDPVFGADASAFWSAMTGYSDPPRLRKLVMAPTMLRERLITLIRREQRRAEAGQPARIRAKMNALVDAELIRALYRASQAGVQIELNVRGICTLRPGIAELSENVTVTSIVGRYLEHARAFVFHNGGEDEVYLASADWMPRNLDTRIELMFPVESAACRRKVLDAFDALLQDNVKGRKLHADGTWRLPPRPPGVAPFDAQAFLHAEAARAATPEAVAVFEPLRDPS